MLGSATIRSMLNKFMRMVAVVLCICCLACGCSRSSAPQHAYDINALKTEGNRILTALRSYKADHGQYPRSLQELPESYLFPLPALGTDNGEWEWLAGLLKERGELGLIVQLYETKKERHSLVYIESRGWFERTDRKQSL